MMVRSEEGSVGEKFLFALRVQSSLILMNGGWRGGERG